MSHTSLFALSIFLFSCSASALVTQPQTPERPVFQQMRAAQTPRFVPPVNCVGLPVVGRDQLILREVLGRGEFGEVYRGALNMGNMVFKVFNGGRYTSTESARLEVARQTMASQTQVSPQVLTGLFCYHDGASLNLAFGMEDLGSSVTLQVYLQRFQPLDPLRIPFMHAAIRLAYASVHALGEAGMAHNDLSPENLMVVLNEAGMLERVAIIDFGSPDQDPGHAMYHPVGALQLPPYLRDRVALIAIYLSLTERGFGDARAVELPRIKQLVAESIFLTDEMKDLFIFDLNESMMNLQRRGISFLRQANP